MTITGTNLSGTTGVSFGGTAATIIGTPSGTQVVVVTPAHAAGSVNVVATTPAGNATSTGGYAYIANNPVPSTSSIIPSSTSAGAAPFALVVNGSNFVSGSVVQWGGSARTTTFVSSTQLLAGILATDIGSAGTVPVVVFNPSPGGGTSNTQTFTITSAGSNPVPTTTSLSPSSAVAGGLGSR